MAPKLITRKNTEPAADYGFFGPDSVTWKVWSYPTSYGLGFIRATVIEHLDPNLAAAVVDTGDVVRRPATRYDRTMSYFALGKFGASDDATKTANVLVKVHAKAVGNDPVTGGRYDANDPDSQLWIHITAWHSILYCYEKFGPGKLTEEEENQYWAECAIDAELQTINVEDVPRTREQVREYFESWRPKLAGSEQAQFMMDFILDGVEYLLPGKDITLLKPLRKALVNLHRRAVIATYPKYQRKLGGIEQGPITDAAAIFATRALYRGLGALPNIVLANILNVAAPSAVQVAGPAVLGVPPRDPHTYSPKESRERQGLLPPREEYARFKQLLEERRAQGAKTEQELGVGPEIAESRELIGAT
ncbi:MAG: DUF2236 domain-containing protein [Solirubrobacterales bacterium]|nr:DUF2236 domain-containing protein [Solirubrobacterales bacterium]